MLNHDNLSLGCFEMVHYPCNITFHYGKSMCVAFEIRLTCPYLIHLVTILNFQVRL